MQKNTRNSEKFIGLNTKEVKKMKKMKIIAALFIFLSIVNKYKIEKQIGKRKNMTHKTNR